MLKEQTVGVNNLPPIPQDPIEENARWRNWFLNLGSYIQQTQVGGIVLTILQGGTGASSAAGARQNLGLGTMSTENSNNVSITGGSVAATIVPVGGITTTITTAKLTTLGTNGSMTFTNGILTASTQAT